MQRVQENISEEKLKTTTAKNKKTGLKICLYREVGESKDSVRDITGWGKDYLGEPKGARRRWKVSELRYGTMGYPNLRDLISTPCPLTFFSSSI